MNRSIFKWLAAFWLACSILFVYLPILVMLGLSLYKSSPDVSSGFLSNMTFEWYQKFLQADDMVSALTGSLLVGLLSTGLTIVLSMLLVLATKWWNPWYLLKSFLINTSMPEIFMAVVILSVFVLVGSPVGIMSLVVGHTLLGLGSAVPIMYQAYLDIDKALIDSSLDLGATYIQTCRYVIIPTLKPVIVAVAFIVFTLSMDDFFINFFCSGVGFQTVSTYVYTAIRAYVDPSLSALSSTLFFLSFCLVLLLSLPNSLEKVFHDE